MPPATRSDLLALCRALPGTTEDVKWGNDLAFSIGGKMYAVFAADGDDATFSCKVDEHDFGSITEIDGVRPAPYAARYHWIAVDDPKALSGADAKSLIRRSHELVKEKLPRKARAQIDRSAPAGAAVTAVAAKEATPKKAAKASAAAKEKPAAAKERPALGRPASKEPATKKATAKKAAPKKW